MKQLLSLVLLFCASFVYGQLNMTLLSNLDYDDVLNDIWGYVDSSGTEYALVGTTEGYSIVSLADPRNPVELQFIPGQSTTWRDIKTWGNFAYVVSDNTNEGMLIVDMSPLPEDTAIYEYWTGPIGEEGPLLRSHNIYIDEFGLAYLSGSNVGQGSNRGAVFALDVKADPWNPEFIVLTDAPYAHDAYARDSVIYSSEIYDGQFFAYDITDPANVVRLGGAQTPFRFTHNAWLSDDSNILFTTDERANAFVGAYDISDWENVRETDRYRPAATVGEGVIPHNVHVFNDYLVISYYTDGVKVVDAARPDNLIEVGDYDTFIGSSGGFSGAWGAYPFLPSGNVLVSDRQSGLFVLEPNYVRGCYLEGVVRDAITGQPVLSAEVRIEADEIITPEMTNISGEFKMGKAVPGSFIVSANHPEYADGSVEATFENGVLTEVVIELTPLPKFSKNGKVLSSKAQGPAAEANLVLMNENFMYATQADVDGIYSIDDVIQGTYRVYAGNWGEYFFGEIEVSSSESEDITIEPGYYDDFHFDYGWTESGTANRGNWVRDAPILETYFGVPCNPGEDVPDDIGFSAFTTGNLGGDARDNSVEGGFTLLSSPPMDLTEIESPVMEFRAWLCVRFEDLQVFSVLLTNGIDTVVVDEIEPDGIAGFWRDPVQYRIEEFIELTDNVQAHFLADNPTDANIVKAAIDAFEVYGESLSSVQDITENMGSFQVFPNPSNGAFTVALTTRSATTPDRLDIYNAYGQSVESVVWETGNTQMDVSLDLAPGLYFVQTVSKSRLTGIQKLIVQ